MKSQNLYRLLVTLFFVLAFIGVLFIFQRQSAAHAPKAGSVIGQKMDRPAIISDGSSRRRA